MKPKRNKKKPNKTIFNNAATSICKIFKMIKFYISNEKSLSCYFLVAAVQHFNNQSFVHIIVQNTRCCVAKLCKKGTANDG